jgi:hypothetical protein
MISKKLYFIPALLIALTLVSCDKDDDSAPPSADPVEPTDPIVFSDLQPNRIAKFERFTSQCGFGDLFTYTGDTLILKTYIDRGQLYFEESFSPFSTNFSLIQPVSYPVTKKGGYILLPEREESSLFFFFGNDTIWTDPVHDVELNQFGCLISYESGEQFTGDEIGFLETYTLGDILLEDQLAISCVPVILDLSAYLVYDRESLKISQFLDDLSFEAKGFVLIDE